MSKTMTSYTLPLPLMTQEHEHGHSHGHGHSHSCTHPPSLSPLQPHMSPRTLMAQRSHRSEHTHTHSESILGGYVNSPPLELKSNRMPYLPTPPNSTGLPPTTVFDSRPQEHSPAFSQISHDPNLEIMEISSPEQKEVVDHSHHLDHEQDRHKHFHGLEHSHTPHDEPRSKFTSLVLPGVLRWPLIHTILSEKDSRRIFYFMSLNFCFMVVQAFYGYATDSLGLLSDSIHMFFDCLALGVGLFAVIASKWPPSERFPYGFGKIESLSGFGNGVFLMLISVEILIEATERLVEGRETKRLGELFVVSSLGLAVNLIGIACFGHHGHAGHDHGGHGHGHFHSHSHSHSDCGSHSHSDADHEAHKEPPSSHCNGHSDNHKHTHSHSHDTSFQDKTANAHSSAVHSHSHDDENMHGIFLHVLADTMGSAAVILSTILIYFSGFYGWDPIASCLIAILIFMSSIPLIKSSAKKLLLTLPDESEYTLRDTLAGVSDLRGVASYYVPKFWLGDRSMDGKSESVLGVMHIVATRGSDLEDLRDRTRDFLLAHGMDVVVQVEKDGDSSCWCGGSSGSRSPLLI